MERESIDLVDETLAKYNSELLSLAGTVCRILYEGEMAQISLFYNDNDEQTKAFHELLKNVQYMP